MVVDREVQVTRHKSGGIGTRIDLTATTTTPTRDTARVVVEAKHLNNAGLLTALREQLIDRYLVPLDRRHGIYLVFWIKPEQRPADWSRTLAADLDAFRLRLQAQADEARADGFRVTPFVLDVSRPG
ncbi:hypothetical protein [Actinokineospora globicatena]|uniref:hypothetical protein n=1 Tax=Actinokineospora globicatena TaxID=103729 RepID=UPI0020A479C4|nr:hypothetical protein [Actinokineospora globicatena]MCP2304534.1 hypothetical protein [Actinokineospora globicatena]GLW78097.1 hypothetical protein Aglo01_25790 [Actinokineospora globicatena]GLW85237.1 hypothetical protein Aglo02_28770 [Actinokineospora globicatena]